MPLTVAAIRYTDDLPAMREFLEVLGLSPAVTSSGWVDLHAGAGRVWLHSAGDADSPSAAGQTNLCFESSDLIGLAERLGTTYVDETFGASLMITDPLGDEVQINSVHADTYGYRTHEPTPDASTCVVAVRFTDPAGPYVRFLRTLGLERSMSAADGTYAQFSAGTGAVGLHVGDGTSLTGRSGALVSLCLTTARDLDTVAKDLQDHGYADATVTHADDSRSVHVTDPDGQQLQIRAA
ncbi:VOC family protein [Allobranchiibius sp. GilTou73]|uniref:VOC family protein n=1 Tax=Allobranchiibius sp. GilTou73 TaxID=2904523 RepID=UPI001F307577|nr:hypothetical protein [Allobranchiibius sp. GilTou73]UIJ34944.1 hypothetical protein LVQ62_00575 [Allobranchiibius sp. GilTou73]